MFGNYRHTFRDQNHAEGKKKTKPSDTNSKEYVSRQSYFKSISELNQTNLNGCFSHSKIRPPLNKKTFPVYRPGGSKRADWKFFFHLFIFQFFFNFFFLLFSLYILV